jgi:hypothetical protein
MSKVSKAHFKVCELEFAHVARSTVSQYVASVPPPHITNIIIVLIPKSVHSYLESAMKCKSLVASVNKVDV